MLVPILHCSVFVHYIVHVRGTALIMTINNPTFAIMIVMLLLLVVIMIISVDERGKAGTNHRSPAFRKGTRSPTMFHMLLPFSVDCRL